MAKSSGSRGRRGGEPPWERERSRARARKEGGRKGREEGVGEGRPRPYTRLPEHVARLSQVHVSAMLAPREWASVAVESRHMLWRDSTQQGVAPCAVARLRGLVLGNLVCDELFLIF